MTSDDMPWEPPLAGSELDHVVGSLERLRATFRWKADDLDTAGLRTRIGASSLTLGGLRTATTGEVLDPQGAAIPGLYAAGRTTSCLSASNCFTSGIQLGEGTFFGRLAGRSAALRSIAADAAVDRSP